MADERNLFGEELSQQESKKNTAKRTEKKSAMNCRDMILADYKSASLDVKSKLAKYDDGNTYLPLSEKIRMFRSDFPDGDIDCSIIIDNNIFATVQCKISCSIGSVTAVAKWYHNNNDQFGMNYLGTAQSNAVSSALRLLGYDAGSEMEPAPEKNISDSIELLPPPETLNGITESAVQQLPRQNDKLTFEQAKSTVINNAPFSGMKIGEILDKKFHLEEFYELMRYFVNHKCVLSPVAEVILEKTNGNHTES